MAPFDGELLANAPCPLTPATGNPDLPARPKRPRHRRRWKRVCVNGRSATARRIRQQADTYRALLGDPVDALTMRRIAEAAELAVVVEDWRGRLLAGDDCEEPFTRLSNLWARAEARLGLPERNAEPPRRTHADVVAAILAGRPAPGEAQDAALAAAGCRTALDPQSEPTAFPRSPESLPP